MRLFFIKQHIEVKFALQSRDNYQQIKFINDVDSNDKHTAISTLNKIVKTSHPSKFYTQYQISRHERLFIQTTEICIICVFVFPYYIFNLHPAASKTPNYEVENPPKRWSLLAF